MRAAHQIGAERHQQTTAEVVAECNGAHEVGPAATDQLCHGERGRHRRAARVRLGDRLEIVGLVGVGAHCVGEPGIDHRRAQIAPDDTRLRRAARAPNVFERHHAGFHPGTRYHRAQRIQDPVFAGEFDLGRQFPIASGHHIARNLPGEVGPGWIGRTGVSTRQGDERRRGAGDRESLAPWQAEA